MLHPCLVHPLKEVLRPLFRRDLGLRRISLKADLADDGYLTAELLLYYNSIL